MYHIEQKTGRWIMFRILTVNDILVYGAFKEDTVTAETRLVSQSEPTEYQTLQYMTS
jgi:hypothetical protein